MQIAGSSALAALAPSAIAAAREKLDFPPRCWGARPASNGVDFTCNSIVKRQPRTGCRDAAAGHYRTWCSRPNNLQ